MSDSKICTWCRLIGPGRIAPNTGHWVCYTCFPNDTMKKSCPKCGYGFSWNARTKSCKNCHWKKEMKTKKKRAVGVYESAIPTTTVEAGSGGKLISRPPCITMKMMREAVALSEKGMMPEGIAVHMEKSVGWVKSSLLIVNKLPEKVHKAIEEHRLSRIAALQLLLCPSDKLNVVIDAAIILSETEGKL